MTRKKKLSKWEFFERVVTVVGLIGIAFSVYDHYFPISNTVYIPVLGWTVTNYVITPGPSLNLHFTAGITAIVIRGAPIHQTIVRPVC